MRVAIIVWGSLHWNPAQLRFIGDWCIDGPSLPIEFARISSGNRLTLVIKPGYDEVTTLYCLSAFETLEEARENLREREGTENIGNIGYLNFIDGSYCVRNSNMFVIDKLRQWNLDKNFDAVIWSDFSPKFSDVLGLPFALQNVINFLEQLSEDERNVALTYIRSAPKQIQTRFRPLIQRHFGSGSIDE